MEAEEKVKLETYKNVHYNENNDSISDGDDDDDNINLFS